MTQGFQAQVNPQNKKQGAGDNGIGVNPINNL
jgi:hypothetical protein